MATPIQAVRVVGKTAGSSLTNKLIVLNNVSIANAFRNIGSWFESVALGARSFAGFVISGGTQAVNAITFSAFVNNDTVTINGVTLTGKTSPASNAEFAIGATDTITAANLVRLINGLSSFGAPPAKVWGVVSATSVGAVVTLTALDSGAIGNIYTLAISAHGSVTGATFASGADGTIISLAKGL